jgi:hypothetical protein
MIERKSMHEQNHRTASAIVNPQLGSSAERHRWLASEKSLVTCVQFNALRRLRSTSDVITVRRLKA